MYVIYFIIYFIILLFQSFIKLYQFIFQIFSLPDKNDEISFTDCSCECKSKKNLHLSNLQEKIKALETQNKQLQNEVTTLKHKRLITLENSDLVVIKHLIEVNEILNNLFVSLQIANYCFRDGKLG